VILLTRLDGSTIAVNDGLIVFAEPTPDTVITMSSGQRLIVKETLVEVLERIATFRRSASPGVLHG
jgi:flagellar protein FlbD